WDELGYHFVIGNGSGSGDGQVEVGPRWPIQKHGAHAKTPDNRYNDYGIGICLVGNFMETNPTPAQMHSLAKLVAFLEERYRIPSDSVIRHKDTKPTDCPGVNLNIGLVRTMATRILVDAGEQIPTDSAYADATTRPTDDDSNAFPTTAPIAATDLMIEVPTAR
ncbi:MAG: N-acetylmuramoyl-L-alanine amidase, partial [Phycisphaerae bacterium]|nr:N-acetylmuramoyl-L-alanine amidase [Phycisphaerae bacterium]